MDANQLNLFKKLLPGLLPIFVFILVDEFWSTEAGLVVAVVFGVGQLGYVFIREKRFDRFIFFDTLLLVALGGISIALNDEIFFKLKPALINLIFCAILGYSAFSSKNLLMIYSQRYVGEMKMPPGSEKVMQKTMKMLFWLMLAYTLLIIYSAYYMSKEAWAFISGGFLYILFGLFFAWQYFTTKRKTKSSMPLNEDWVPLVDETGKITGKATRRAVHNGPGMLHPVVHLQLFNSKGEIYLQKRASHKDVEPGKWDSSVGGHVDLGETIEQALMRETAEELNLKGIRPIPLVQYKWESAVESELVFSFTAIYNTNPVFNKQEIEDGRFWSIDEIRKSLGKGVFTPNFETEFPLILKAISEKRSDTK
jgi:isopentenyldiphosphate isomerase/intracellular septation protein A